MIVLKIIIIFKLLSFELLFLILIGRLKKDIADKNKLINMSISYVKHNFGRLNNIVAATRGGKSVFLTGLSHCQTIIIDIDLKERLTKIVNTLDKLDFRKINHFLDAVYSYSSDYNLAYQLLLEYIDKNNYIYFDYINVKSYDEMIKEYAEWYYQLYYRGSYMLCKGISIFDRIKCCPAKLLIDETLRLKEVSKTGIYYIQRCSIINEDEISVTDSNTNSFSTEEKTSGKKEFKIFLGQASKETSYFNSCKQTQADEIVTTRRLTNTVYVPTSCKEIIYAFPRIQKLLDFYLAIKYFFYKFKYIYIIFPSIRHRKMEEDMLSNKCSFKKALSKVDNIKNWCNSEGILVHRGILFDNDPINNKLKIIDDDVVLMFPLIWSWGAYRTHEYADLQEFMEDMSDIKINQIVDTARISNDSLTFEKLKWLVEKKEEDNEF